MLKVSTLCVFMLCHSLPLIDYEGVPQVHSLFKTEFLL